MTNNSPFVLKTVSIFSIAALVAYLLLCFFISPSGDDYSYAWTGANTKDIATTLLNEFFYWNGRYTSNVLVLKNPIGSNSFIFYQCIPALLLVGFFLSHFFVLKKAGGLNTRLTAGITCIFLLLYLHTMPEIAEGIYWYTSAVTYFAPLIILPIYFYFILTIKHSIWGTLGLFLLQLLLNGFNEIIMLLLTVFHCLYFVAIVLKKISCKQERKLIQLFLLVSQIVFACIVFFAPGNEVRGSYFPHKYELINTFLWGTIHTVRFSSLLLFNPFLWIGIYCFTRVKNHLRITPVNVPFHYWVIAFLSPQIIACFGPIWTTGILGQHRTVNLANYVQIIIVASYFLLQDEKFVPKQLTKILAIIPSKKGMVFIFTVGFCFGNTFTVVKDLLSGEAKKFKIENEKRHTLLQSFANYNDTTIAIPSFENHPSSIFIYDISEDKNDWKNEVYTTFFNLKQNGVFIVKKQDE